MIKKAKKFFQWSLLLAIIGLGVYSIWLREVGVAHAAQFSRVSLQAYEHNLDVLEDKQGSLDDLIGELQNSRVLTATGAVVGTTVPVPGILPTDSINSIVIYSSGSDFSGSTVIGRPGECQLFLQSKIGGLASTRLSVTFTRKGNTDVSSNTLTIGTTGYSFEVKLASADGRLSANGMMEYSSGPVICAAINGHSWLGSLIRCSTGSNSATSFSTAGFTTETGPQAMTNQGFYNNVPAGAWGGANNIEGYKLYHTTVAAWTSAVTIPNNGFVTIPSSGNIQISTGSPVNPSDSLGLNITGYRN